LVKSKAFHLIITNCVDFGWTMKKHLFIFLVILLFGCTLDSPDKDNLPTWSTTIEIPIIQTRIDLDTFLEDSLISIEGLDQYFDDGNAGDSVFVFRKEIKIEKVEVGDQLEIDPISTSFTQGVDDVTVEGVEKVISSKVGTITLDDIDSSASDPFIFRDIFPAVDDIPEGQFSAIPAFELEPVINPFSFDDFGYAIFSGGQLQITIQNDMVIPLGSPIYIQFQQVSGTDTTDIPNGVFQFNTVIDANGGSVSDTLNLAGMTLPGDILIKVSGSSQGTQGIQILIDEDAKNSGFQVIIDCFGLEVTSASAKIPQQTIEADGSIALEPDSNKVVRATIQSGNLIVEVDNYMALSSNLNILIPSIETPGGTPFQISLDIPKLTPDIFSQTSIQNHSLVMEADSQLVNYSYRVVTVDTGNELIPITSEDSIVVRIRLEGAGEGEDISFSEFTGYLSQDAMVDSSEIVLDDSTRIQTAVLKSGELYLSIQNNIGIDANIFFQIDEFSKGSDVLDTAFSINEGGMDIMIDLSGYTLELPMDVDTQKVHYVSRISFPDDVLQTIIFGDSIGVEVDLRNISFESITGSINPVTVEIDPVEQEIDLPDELEELEFTQVLMDLYFFISPTLTLPVYLDLQIVSFNDETGDSAVKFLDHVNIIENPIVSIDSAQHLINILPNRITVGGQTEIGSLNSVGTITTTDTLSGKLLVAAPLVFTIDASSRIEGDPQSLDKIEVDQIEEATLYLDYVNEFEFGANITVLLDTDISSFEKGTSDTLFTLDIEPDAVKTDSINLDDGKLNLLIGDSLYVKIDVQLLGTQAKFLSTDSLEILLYGAFQYLLDGPGLAGGGE